MLKPLGSIATEEGKCEPDFGGRVVEDIRSIVKVESEGRTPGFELFGVTTIKGIGILEFGLSARLVPRSAHDARVM